MSTNIENTFDALEIRDTSAHTGKTVYNGDFIIKTLIIESSLDEDASLQCQGSAHADFSKSFDIGAPFIAEASTNSYQTCDSYFPYWRVVATCSSSPSSGDLTLIVMGVN